MSFVQPDDPKSAMEETRSAPRWVWEIVDQTLIMAARGESFDRPALRSQTGAAASFMDDVRRDKFSE